MPNGPAARANTTAIGWKQHRRICKAGHSPAQLQAGAFYKLPTKRSNQPPTNAQASRAGPPAITWEIKSRQGPGVAQALLPVPTWRGTRCLWSQATMDEGNLDSTLHGGRAHLRNIHHNLLRIPALRSIRVDRAHH